MSLPVFSLCVAGHVGQSDLAGDTSWDNIIHPFICQSLIVLGDHMVFPVRKTESFGRAAQLVKVLSPYAKVMGSIPSQGTCKNQPVNA